MGPGTASNSPKTMWEVVRGGSETKVKGERLSSSLSFLRRPPLPTGAGGRGPTVPCPEGSKNHPGDS